MRFEGCIITYNNIITISYRLEQNLLSIASRFISQYLFRIGSIPFARRLQCSCSFRASSTVSRGPTRTRKRRAAIQPASMERQSLA